MSHRPVDRPKRPLLLCTIGAPLLHAQGLRRRRKQEKQGLSGAEDWRESLRALAAERGGLGGDPAEGAIAEVDTDCDYARKVCLDLLAYKQMLVGGMPSCLD